MGINGFEGAHEWESKIKHLSKGKKYEELWSIYLIYHHKQILVILFLTFFDK